MPALINFNATLHGAADRPVHHALIAPPVTKRPFHASACPFARPLVMKNVFSASSARAPVMSYMAKYKQWAGYSEAVYHDKILKR